MSRTAVYLRKSSEAEDRQSLSLPAQLEWAQNQCARLGINGPLIFQESKSAKTPGRPEFARMMALVQSGAIDTIICWKADRLARNALDGGAVLFALESKKLTQIVTDDRTYRGEPDEEFVLTLELGLSSKYSKDLSKNVKRGLAEKWRRGEWCSRAPIGYTNRRENADHSSIAVDPILAPWIKKLFQLAGTGNYSLLDLTRIVRDEWHINLATRRRDRLPSSISASTIHYILRNPFYRGLMLVKGQLYAGSHRPLVSKELFDRVQAILAGRRVRGERPQREVFAFSGISRCAGCGRQLVGYVKRRERKEYRYYACSNHLHGVCPEPPVSEAQMFDAILPALAQASITSDEQTLIARMLDQATEEHRESAAAVRQRAQKQLADLDARASRLVDLVIDGTLHRDIYDQKQRDLAGERVEYMLTINAADQDPEWLEQVRNLFAGLTDATNVFQRSSATEKRGLLRQIGLELSAKDKKPLVHARTPTAALMNRGEHPAWWGILSVARTYFCIRASILALLR
jgi:DNA invertase Pin-like site-specific DNA recombinase